MPLIKVERASDGKLLWIDSEKLDSATHKPVGDKPKAKARKKNATTAKG
jgi:hypothetical protein